MVLFKLQKWEEYRLSKVNECRDRIVECGLTIEGIKAALNKALGATYAQNLSNKIEGSENRTERWRIIQRGIMEYGNIDDEISRNLNFVEHYFDELDLSDLKHIRSSITSAAQSSLLHMLSDRETGESGSADYSDISERFKKLVTYKYFEEIDNLTRGFTAKTKLMVKEFDILA